MDSVFFDRDYRPGVGLVSYIFRRPGGNPETAPTYEVEHPDDATLWYQKKMKQDDIRVLHRFEIPPRLWERLRLLHYANNAGHREWGRRFREGR